MFREKTPHMSVRLKFSISPLNMNLLSAILLQMLYIVRDIIDIITDIVFSQLNKGKSKTLPPITSPILLMSATELAKKIRKREITSEEAVEAYVNRIKGVNPVLNAVVEERFELALKEARAVDKFLSCTTKTEEEIAKENPFYGVPFTVKDNFQVQGMRQTVGLVARKNCISKEDAAAVTALRKAGAIPVGVTNLSELCTWWESDNFVYGKTCNPYDTTRIVGGSSGGEGSILAAAGSIMGIGSDIGGSIRMPSFFNGIFGHKPSMGIVSNVGQKPDLSNSLKTYLATGPMCRYASDLAPIMKVLAGPNVDKLKLDQKVDIKNLKFYYMDDDGGYPLISRIHPELRKAQKKIIYYLDKVYGIRAKKVMFPSMVRSLEIWANLLCGLQEPPFCEEMAMRKGRVNIYWELIKKCFGMSTHTLPALIVGLSEKLGIGKDKQEHEHLAKMCTELREDFQTVLKDNGIFLYPSHPTPAPYHHQPLFQAFNFAYSAIFSVLGLPVTQCPLGLGSEGLPLGIQVVSSLNNDHLCLAVAKELEKAFGGWVCPSPVMQYPTLVSSNTTEAK